MIPYQNPFKSDTFQIQKRNMVYILYIVQQSQQIKASPFS